MTMKKQRGRPKGGETLEKERIDAFFKNLPAHIPRMTQQERDELDRRSEANKKIEAEFFAGHSPTISHKLILDIESLGDVHLYEETEALLEWKEKKLKKYKTFVEAEFSGRLKGAQTTLDKAKARATLVWGKNQDLANKIGKNHTIHSASTKLLNEWDLRGDGGKKPSIGSAQNWYRKYFLK